MIYVDIKYKCGQENILASINSAQRSTVGYFTMVDKLKWRQNKVFIVPHLWLYVYCLKDNLPRYSLIFASGEKKKENFYC